MLGDLGLWQKHVPFDPSVRIPLIACGPGIPAGRKADALVELSDLNPTICEWAGLQPQLDIDAQSCADLLAGTSEQHRTDCYTVERPFRALRTRDHLYVQHNTAGATGSEELYNLSTDPHATTNIAAEQPDMVAQLRLRLRDRVRVGRWNR